ncbi:unnamed protein product [Prorocentrum cordatum]|uniref:Uncharacterized protein n=1 Tax=Prorocentrum cordatum TaxID=2364126 RepID=A0ABN9QDZ3_9DINO|nr:unnamed protein product [Polarella glacialis]
MREGTGSRPVHDAPKTPRKGSASVQVREAVLGLGLLAHTGSPPPAGPTALPPAMRRARSGPPPPAGSTPPRAARGEQPAGAGVARARGQPAPPACREPAGVRESADAGSAAAGEGAEGALGRGAAAGSGATISSGGIHSAGAQASRASQEPLPEARLLVDVGAEEGASSSIASETLEAVPQFLVRQRRRPGPTQPRRFADSGDREPTAVTASGVAATASLQRPREGRPDGSDHREPARRHGPAGPPGAEPASTKVSL